MAVMGSIPYIIWHDTLQEISLTGYLGLMVSCIISNGTVFLPASSILYVLFAGTVLNAWLCCLIGGIGTAIGEQIGYFCGRSGSQIVKDAVFLCKVSNWLEKNSFYVVFLFALLPLPIFDIVGVAAGSCRMKWHEFTLASILGKILKMFIAAFIIYYVLPEIKDLIPLLPKQWSIDIFSD